MIDLHLPAFDETISRLSVGDVVRISGSILTARDRAHKYFTDTFVKPDAVPESEHVLHDKLMSILNGGIIYHCGPVVAQRNGEYRFVAAGPTTSIREEPYQAAVIEHFGIKGVIGKGGMGAGTLAACRNHTAAYLHAVGGAASLIARNVIRVRDVFKLEEFGVPEAMWWIEVDGLETTVTLDSHGNSLHKDVYDDSTVRLDALLDQIG